MYLAQLMIHYFIALQKAVYTVRTIVHAYNVDHLRFFNNYE